MTALLELGMSNLTSFSLHLLGIILLYILKSEMQLQLRKGLNHLLHIEMLSKITKNWIINLKLLRRIAPNNRYQEAWDICNAQIGNIDLTSSLYNSIILKNMDYFSIHYKAEESILFAKKGILLISARLRSS